MRCPKGLADTTLCTIVQYPYVLYLRHQKVLRQALDLSRPNISPTSDPGQLHASFLRHFLVPFNLMCLDKPSPWYHLPLLLSIPNAILEHPWTLPEKHIYPIVHSHHELLISCSKKSKPTSQYFCFCIFCLSCRYDSHAHSIHTYSPYIYLIP